ncbi:MAG TPA: radical SAM protein [Pyrinomonadaceae bacterium]
MKQTQSTSQPRAPAARHTPAPAAVPRRRVLVVNCYFDDSRRPVRRATKVPQAMGPVYLAGAFARAHCDVRLYSELASGPLEDEALLGWPDLLVLTGLTNTFDRMLHLTAYARTKNPRVVVAAGGPAVRQLPRLAARVFDYACLGDVEELREVARAALGPDYVAEEMEPRFDLAYWLNWLGHVESSRYCNFRCAFCALTGEGRDYQPYELAALRRQLVAAGRKRRVLFIDNNFYGNDRAYFDARLALIEELRADGYLKEWSAILTNDFFARADNLARVRAAGCLLLFSGVESFDPAWLRQVNKRQNVVHPTVEMIRRCLEAGIVFCYGLMLDTTTRRVADLRRELDFITATPEITLPSFLTLSIPLLGTPYFFDLLRQRALLPRLKLRDLDSTTLVTRPLDPLPEVVAFLRAFETMRGYRLRVLRHTAGFARRYARRLNRVQLAAVLGNAALTCAHDLASTLNGRDWLRRRGRARTYVTTTEPLDDQYTPKFRVAARYAHHFRPMMITDERGELTAEMLAAGLLKTGKASASTPEITTKTRRHEDTTVCPL